MLWTIITLGLVAWVLVIFAGRFITDYRSHDGTPWARALYASEDSAVILWSYFLGFTNTVLAWVASAAQFLNFPEVQSFIQNYLPPTWVSVAFVLIAIVNVIARLRTLWAS